MLAERGAVIVDADQIARDLQAPGTPVVTAMAERFGDHILDDDGALIRPEVAKIVFSDPDALKDLNAIVHPAMQAEIQRQITAHVDTDRVVVLDFPLLGENPRKGLAANIVVDVPTELAIERAIERGMDADDVRNRVNSQLPRIDRLALAPRVAWVFGYGSLVSPSSLAKTIGRRAKPERDFHRATLTGYGRRWNYGVGHINAAWTGADGAEVPDGTVVALGLVASPDETTNGVIASVDAEELAALDHRERDYARVEVTAQTTFADDIALGGLPIVTYVPRPLAVERYETARDRGTAGVRQLYWDLVDDAFERLGEGERDCYRASTPDPDVPII